MGNDARELCGDGALDVKAAIAFSGIRRAWLFQLMASGELPFIRLRRKRLVPRSALVRLLESGLQQAPASPTR